MVSSSKCYQPSSKLEVAFTVYTFVYYRVYTPRIARSNKNLLSLYYHARLAIYFNLDVALWRHVVIAFFCNTDYYLYLITILFFCFFTIFSYLIFIYYIFFSIMQVLLELQYLLFSTVVLKLCVATPRCVVSIFQRRRGII